MRIANRTVVLLLVSGILVGASVAPAAAKNACLSTGDRSSIFVFESVKKPTAGKSVALRGIYIGDGTITAPFDGSAVMRSDKTTVIAGIFVHNATSFRNFTMEWVTTTALAGDAPFDADGSYKTDDGPLSLFVIDSIARASSYPDPPRRCCLDPGRRSVLASAGASAMAALTANPYAAAYHMSKHAVLALSEALHHELRGLGAKIGVSALCPEAVATQIDDSERNRPVALRATPEPVTPDVELVNGAIRAAVAGGIPTQIIADRVLSAIREDRFYVLSDADAWRRSCESRLDDIRLARNPTFVPPV